MVRRVFLAFLGFALVACGDDSTGPESITGTYTLQSIDGEVLPAFLAVPTEAITIEITAGSVTLEKNMTCLISLSLRGTVDGTVSTGRTETEGCTYTFTGSQAEFAIAVTFSARTVSGGGSIFAPLFGSILDAFGLRSGSVAGSTLTLNSLIDGHTVFIFRK